jgi:GT2 family glycosyltransferase
MRARRAGARLAYVRDAEAVHLGGQSRQLDVESNSVTSVASAAAFWDLAFPRPAATVLKATLLLSLCVSLAKNAVLAPFVAARRPRVAHLSYLCGRTARMVLRPVAGHGERASW